MEVHLIEQNHHVPCSVFLKPKCATSLGQLEKFWAAHLPSKKTWPPLLCTEGNSYLVITFIEKKHCAKTPRHAEFFSFLGRGLGKKGSRPKKKYRLRDMGRGAEGAEVD